MTALDPQFAGRRRDRDCIDGGGRNGRPTLLATIAAMKGDQPTLKLTDQVWDDLASAIGVAGPATVREELLQMEESGTVMTFTKRLFPAKGQPRFELDMVGLTTFGREYLAAKS